jgi:hypothetical protein
MKELTSEELCPDGNNVLHLEAMVEVWRYIKGQRLPCNFSMGVLLEFDYDYFMELCGTPIKEGYYFANHGNQKGAYLGPDWKKDAVPGLLARGYATLEREKR